VTQGWEMIGGQVWVLFVEKVGEYVGWLEIWIIDAAAVF
jgi:hypothetical protein